MTPLTTETLPLTLSEQLDAMLLGWLERQAGRDHTHRPDVRGKAVLTVASGFVPELERFCEQWEVSLEHTPAGDRWTVLVIEGPALPVQGLTEITGMYRR